MHEEEKAKKREPVTDFLESQLSLIAGVFQTKSERDEISYPEVLSRAYEENDDKVHELLSELNTSQEQDLLSNLNEVGFRRLMTKSLLSKFRHWLRVTFDLFDSQAPHPESPFQSSLFLPSTNTVKKYLELHRYLESRTEVHKK